MLAVADNGPGLAAAAPDAEGPDLGLAVAAMIVEAHGGTLTAASRPEGGARFELSLPEAE